MNAIAVVNAMEENATPKGAHRHQVLGARLQKHLKISLLSFMTRSVMKFIQVTGSVWSMYGPTEGSPLCEISYRHL